MPVQCQKSIIHIFSLQTIHTTPIYSASFATGVDENLCITDFLWDAGRKRVTNNGKVSQVCQFANLGRNGTSHYIIIILDNVEIGKLSYSRRNCTGQLVRIQIQRLEK